jgi:translation elongation factor EF-G
VHDGVKINVIDTPGYADFISDAIAAMEAAEMALFVVDAVAGPQVQTNASGRSRARWASHAQSSSTGWTRNTPTSTP